MPAKIQLIGGLFQDSEGTPLANGYLTFKLSQDGSVSGVGSVCAGIEITIKLNSSGSVDVSTPQYIWANDQILPINSFYKVTGYTAQGQPAWGPNNQQVIGSGGSFDVGTWVPNQVFSWQPPISSVLLKTNGVPNSVQTVLNLIGTGVSNSGGDTTISGGGSGSSFLEIDLTASSGGTRTITPTEAAHNMLRFTGTVSANTSVVFPASVVGTWYIERWVGGTGTVSFTTDALFAGSTVFNEDTFYFNDGTADNAGFFKAVTSQNTKWEVDAFIAGKPTAGQVLYFRFTQNRVYEPGDFNCIISVIAPPTSSASFIIALSTDDGVTFTDFLNTSIGAGQRASTSGLVGPGLPVGTSGVVVRVTCVSPQDATMSDVSISFSGVW